tara:strand:- start:253 stop:477 length:225 start_codon:yes stop_codon:yes gene_type:complete
MSESKERSNFLEKLNRLIDNHHHSLYLIDGVFEGVRSIKESIREYESKEPTKDTPGFEGTLEALDSITIKGGQF